MSSSSTSPIQAAEDAVVIPEWLLPVVFGSFLALVLLIVIICKVDDCLSTCCPGPPKPPKRAKKAVRSRKWLKQTAHQAKHVPLVYTSGIMSEDDEDPPSNYDKGGVVLGQRCQWIGTLLTNRSGNPNAPPSTHHLKLTLTFEADGKTVTGTGRDDFGVLSMIKGKYKQYAESEDTVFSLTGFYARGKHNAEYRGVAAGTIATGNVFFVKKRMPLTSFIFKRKPVRGSFKMECVGPAVDGDDSNSVLV